MFQVPRELPNADPRSLTHLFDEGFLERAKRQVAPQRHVAIRVIPSVVAALFCVGESLFFQQPKMVGGHTILEAEGMLYIRERGSWSFLDVVKDQGGDLPLEDFLSGQA